jgi:hypothetical protein
MHVGFWWGNLKKRDYLESLGIGVRILLKWFSIGWKGVD